LYSALRENTAMSVSIAPDRTALPDYQQGIPTPNAAKQQCQSTASELKY